jgi:hypothetical protein
MAPRLKSPTRSRIILTEDEHKLIQRYREQARAFNEGLASAIEAVQSLTINITVDPEATDEQRKLGHAYDGGYARALIDAEQTIAKLRKDTV